MFYSILIICVKLSIKFKSMLNITHISVIMKKVKKPVKFKSLSIPEPLFKEMKEYVQNSPKYRNMAEFLRESIRFKMNVETGNISLSGFQNDPIRKDLDKLFIEIEKIRKEMKKEK